MITSLVKGFWTALKCPKLVLLLWVWTLLLGLVAAMPAREFFGRTLDTAIEAEGLLTRFNIGTLADVSKYNDVSPFGLMMAAMTGIGLLALVGSAFVNGGMVEVIGSRDDDRTFMHRFFRGGGHFFWRFVRLALIAYIPAALAGGLVASGIGALTAPLANSEWEPAGMFWGLVSAGIAGLVALAFVLALDYARIRVARDGARGMFRAYFAALGFVLRHGFATYGMAIVCLAVTGGLLLAYVGHEAVWTASSWSAIWVLIAVQQVIVLARAGVRVTLVAAEWQYFDFAAQQPRPAEVPLPPAARVAAAEFTGPAPVGPSEGSEA